MNECHQLIPEDSQQPVSHDEVLFCKISCCYQQVGETENISAEPDPDLDFDSLQYPLYTPHQERLSSEDKVYFRPTSTKGIM